MNFKTWLLTGMSFACLLISALPSKAFALLGPIQPWMITNGVVGRGDIGGPMAIGDEYRWNTPVITYAYDSSFLIYYGSNGVAAVESAIQLLNNLPPSSAITITNFPFDTTGVNYTAASAGLLDLKSQALSALLEHMGLASPDRYIYALRHSDSSLVGTSSGDWDTNIIPGFIVQRNYDPQTLTPSIDVNNMLMLASLSNVGGSIPQYEITTYPADPFAPSDTAVADFDLNVGTYYTGLTYDDVGGLAYLLSTNTIHYEYLLPGTTGTGTNQNSYVNGAWRPGVDKITFARFNVEPVIGVFPSPTNIIYTDRYITNGVVMCQQVARTEIRPDIVFSAGNPLPNQVSVGTGTANWLNVASENNAPGAEGPGVIQPPVQITFCAEGTVFFNESDVEAIGETLRLGSYDGTTNPPVQYPQIKSANVQSLVEMWLTPQTVPYPQTNQTFSFSWTASGPVGMPITFQTSSDLISWTDLFTNSNDGSVCNFVNQNPTSPSRFYRLKPSP